MTVTVYRESRRYTFNLTLESRNIKTHSVMVDESEKLRELLHHAADLFAEYLERTERRTE